MNPYKVLGVKRKATKDEIKEAYKDLAKKHHPDVGGDEEKFKKINDAYQILSNPELKEQYDRTGMEPGSQSYEYHMRVIDLFKSHVFGQINNSRPVSIELVSRNLRSRISSLDEELENFGKLIDLLEKQREAVKQIKKKKLNCYNEAIDGLIEDAEMQMKSKEVEVKRLQKLLKIVSNYTTIEKMNLRLSEHREDAARFTTLVFRNQGSF